MKALYKTYLFKNKDPVIDVLRSALQLEADTQGIKFGKAMGWASKQSGVTYQTLHNWFFGPTRCPKYCCVAAVANALRASWQIGVRKPNTTKREERVDVSHVVQ
jgi:hypothetical protein